MHLKESSKQGIFQVFTFFGICTLMCGAFIGILVSSGWLLLLADEGQEKKFLLPLLILLSLLFFIYKKRKKQDGQCCATFSAKAMNFILYVSISLLFSAVVMLYIFIPWWLPDYKGGPLLP